MVGGFRREHGGSQSAVVQSCGVQLGRFHREVPTAIRGASAIGRIWQRWKMQSSLFAVIGFLEMSVRHIPREKHSIG